MASLSRVSALFFMLYSQSLHHTSLSFTFLIVQQPVRTSCSHCQHRPSSNRHIILHSTSDGRDADSSSSSEKKGSTNKKGYQFGDITKSLVNKLTKKEKYEFGDLSRYIDSQIKDRVNQLTGKEKYEVGDLTKEITRRVTSGDYKLDDILLLCKALLTLGASLSPVAKLLPIKMLVEMLNYSLVADVGGKVTEAVSLEIDKRFKEAIMGDKDYKMGDLTKKQILSFTGKEEYQLGDITKAVFASMEEQKKGGGGKDGTGMTTKQFLSDAKVGIDPVILSELESIDKARPNDKE